MSRAHPNRWLQAGINIAIVAALLSAISFLPPDTSLADRQKAGALKVCVPASFPPLVTGDAARPGFDIELVQAIAGQLNLQLAVNVLPSIGKDYNPRNWFLTRAQCDLVAGGVADTVQTRSFMQTIPTEAETGWVGISASGEMPDAGSVVAVLPGTTGLDRLALSSWLRQQGLRGQLVRSPNELTRLLASGAAAAAVTERFTAAELQLDSTGLRMFWLDEQTFPHFAMALGLWKGDQTLRRAVAGAMETLEKAGTLATLRDSYGLSGAVVDGTP